MTQVKSGLEFLTTLPGLAINGLPVHRRFESVPALPALVLRMGSDSVGAKEFGTFQRTLEVLVDIMLRKDAATETSFNQMRAEIYAGMMNDSTLGLDFVTRTDPVSDDEPTQKDLERPVVSQTLRFVVTYQHSTKTVEG